jgi:ADP-ribose pyrophosphatase YjhB (NUDIX family)
MINVISNTKVKDILVGGSVVYKKDNGKITWFVIKEEGGEWELPKTLVRRGESSVRSVIRAMSEQAGMKAKVLEEAGRGSRAVMHNNKPTDQKIIYYLLVERGGGEVLGFDESQWMDYAKAVKKLDKKEQKVLQQARDLQKEVEKKAKKNPIIEEEVDFEEELIKEVTAI